MAYAYYTVFGQRVGAHILAAATLGTTGLGAWLATRGPKTPNNEPPINAASKEEESHVKEFLKKKASENKH